MARNRTGTEALFALDRDKIEAALEAAAAAGSKAAFYKQVRMRNPSRSYFVSYKDQHHSLKAVAAYALQLSISDTLARDFHASDAAYRLSQLGFDIVHDAK